MYKITVKGLAKTNYPKLKELDGISSQEEFSPYFDTDFTFRKDVTGGFMEFKFENGELWVYVEYDSTRELTKSELDALGEYTQGQLSDGIGEGYCQEPCYEAEEPFNKYDPEYGDYEDQEDADNDLGVFISPWFFGQVVTTEQNKV